MNSVTPLLWRKALRNVPLVGATIFAALIAGAGAALAQEAGLGAPFDWQMGFQEPASPVMRDIIDFHNFMLWLITIIVIFVLGLMLYIMFRFNAKSNPVPSKNTHNTLLEVIWTVVPIIILVVMAVPSFRLLYQNDVVPTPTSVADLYGVDVSGEITLKATGLQWAWEYEYVDNGVFLFSSCLYGPDYWCFGGEAPEGAHRLLETDNPVVVPVNTLVKVQVTAAAVIHAWAVPAFGVKIDAVPGRLNETWFVAERIGTYYGQCSELCGQYHSYMPIQVNVVSQEDYDAWMAGQLAAMQPDRLKAPTTEFAQQGITPRRALAIAPDLAN
ncbi:MAG: cytochrome c oxidase subunit II [Alphaproteobacteria bacterium]|jgi:cytochrome c oxidase subunit II|nr:cytochrome c oxidase subunit II [Alphaproteobacteria bacterium]